LWADCDRLYGQMAACVNGHTMAGHEQREVQSPVFVLPADSTFGHSYFDDLATDGESRGLWVCRFVAE